MFLFVHNVLCVSDVLLIILSVCVYFVDFRISNKFLYKFLYILDVMKSKRCMELRLL